MASPLLIDGDLHYRNIESVRNARLAARELRRKWEAATGEAYALRRKYRRLAVTSLVICVGAWLSGIAVGFLVWGL